MYLGQVIKNYRTKNKCSMDAFALKSGLSKAYISLLEKKINILKLVNQFLHPFKQ